MIGGGVNKQHESAARCEQSGPSQPAHPPAPVSKQRAALAAIASNQAAALCCFWGQVQPA